MDTAKLIEEAERWAKNVSESPGRGTAGEDLYGAKLLFNLAAALRETTARADRQKQQFDEALGDLMDAHAEEIRKRGLSNAVTAETYDACHAALRQTEEERDRERKRADDLAAANLAANKRIEALEHESDAARAELGHIYDLTRGKMHDTTLQAVQRELLQLKKSIQGQQKRADRLSLSRDQEATRALRMEHEVRELRAEKHAWAQRAADHEKEKLEARAELARLTTPRPIAEAPRDGTWIGAVWEEMTPEERARFGPIVVVRWSGTCWEDSDGDGYEPPSHYLPLPEVKPCQSP